jgi:metallo-beta-lactamase family protein
MQIKLSFLGAAQNVTGSRHLLSVDGATVLVDCGLYQERQFSNRNWDPFPVDPSSIDAVLLTHAHLDHCGLLPKLVKDGFKGRIYCTDATADLVKIILLDSAKIQEEDAEHKRKRHKKEGREAKYPEIPLYTVEDAEACFPQFSTVEYKASTNIKDGVEAEFFNAGHVLGSSIIRVRVHLDGQERVVLFSGDVGRPNRPIIEDLAIGQRADYVLIESTYGDRLHEDTEDIKKIIAEVINSTVKAGGNIIVPSFALERSQEVLYYINELLTAKAIPPLRIFLDSPMASKITEVFHRHPELFDEEMTDSVKRNSSLFNMPGLEMTSDVEESKAINKIKGPIMVIAGSGMCNAGRVKHHLVNNISRRENTIMFVGYEAAGTLGRQIVDGAKEVRILGQQYPVKARIVQIHGFSAHADRDELLKWLLGFQIAPRGVFVVHGEGESAKSFGEFVRKKTGWQVTVPEYQQQVILD